jgi:hypothetical protein
MEVTVSLPGNYYDSFRLDVTNTANWRERNKIDPESIEDPEYAYGTYRVELELFNKRQSVALIGHAVAVGEDLASVVAEAVVMAVSE